MGCEQSVVSKTVYVHQPSANKLVFKIKQLCISHFMFYLKLMRVFIQYIFYSVIN